jgi:hypothetical protein
MTSRLSPEHRRLFAEFLLSLLVSLIVIGATNALYWQPQLDYLSQQLKASQLQISVSPGESWIAVNNTACAVVHPGGKIDFQITNKGHDPVQVLRAFFTMPGGNFTHDIYQTLQPGDLLVITYRFREVPNQIMGQRGEFTIQVVTVELPLQTTSFCITST